MTITTTTTTSTTALLFLTATTTTTTLAKFQNGMRHGMNGRLTNGGERGKFATAQRLLGIGIGRILAATHLFRDANDLIAFCRCQAHVGNVNVVFLRYRDPIQHCVYKKGEKNDYILKELNSNHEAVCELVDRKSIFLRVNIFLVFNFFHFSSSSYCTRLPGCFGLAAMVLGRNK
jgi:hypothetical protein